MPDVKPIPGAETTSVIDQARMVVPSENELPNEETHDARSGGSVYTCMHSETETRPQDLHGSVNYQKTTSTGGKPNFVAYTDLTSPRKEIRG